jgi:Tfp pilus assembly protein PilE
MKQTRVQRFASYRAHIQKMRTSNSKSMWSRYGQMVEQFFLRNRLYLNVLLWSLLSILGVIVMGLFFFGRTST